MDRLWAPWREKYITGKKPRGCFLCRAIRSPAAKDRGHYLVERTARSFSILNRYPYNNGHLLLAPRRHVKDFSRLTPEEICDLFALFNRSLGRLDRVLRPHGYNVGCNLGRVGGAGVPGHLHLHLVPRWLGDTNFMPVTAGTKVVSQSLDVLYEKLRKPMNKRPPGGGPRRLSRRAREYRRK